MKVENIKLEFISVDENQPRIDAINIGILSSSIVKNGLIHPIEIIKKKKDKYIIVDGERRYRAFLLLKRDTIPSIVKQDDEIKDIFLRQAITDFHKEKLNLIEQCEVVHKLEAKDYDNNQICHLLGFGKTKLNNLKRIRNFNDNTKKHIVEGTITQNIIQSLTKHEIRPEYEDAIINEIIDKKKKSAYEIDSVVLDKQNIRYHVNNFLRDSYVFENKIIKFNEVLTLNKKLVSEEISRSLKSNDDNFKREARVLRDKLDRIMKQFDEIKKDPLK